MIAHHSLSTVRERIVPVLAECPELVLAFVFGSVARGQAHSGSDVDIAVQFSSATPDLRPILSRLCECLGTDQVDLVDLGVAGPVLRHRVARDGYPVLVKDPSALIRFRFLAQRDFLETAPLREQWWSAFRRRWAPGDSVGS